MSDTNPNADMPTQGLPAYGDLAEIEMPPAEGWVIHEVAGKPQQTEGRIIWAWCMVTTEGPGYTDILFTEADGQTIADPYPKPTPDSPDRPLVLGKVLFKVFC